SPSKPLVNTAAEESSGIWSKCLSMESSTSASSCCGSSSMDFTEPMRTPAIFTGARSLSWPTLVKRALTVYESPCRVLGMDVVCVARTARAAKPSRMKRPVPAASERLGFTAHSSWYAYGQTTSGTSGKESGQHEIQRQDGDGRGDHGAGGGVGHAFAGRRGGVALVHGDQRDHGAEGQALVEHAVDDVGPHIDGGRHVGPERAVVDAQPGHADQMAAENGHG